MNSKIPCKLILMALMPCMGVLVSCGGGGGSGSSGGNSSAAAVSSVGQSSNAQSSDALSSSTNSSVQNSALPTSSNSSSNTSSPVAGTPPVITSGLVATAYEGTVTAVYNASALIGAGGAASYSIAGTDADKFNINSVSGAISFKSAPTFASPTDADADNEYLISLTVTDGGQSASQTLSIQVVRDIPSSNYSWASVPWGAGGYIPGVLYHPTVEGLLYLRTDVGGVYRRDPGSDKWIALNDDMGRDDGQLGGIQSIAVDPNDSNKLYVAAGSYYEWWGRKAAILRSSDRGATWARTEVDFHLGGNADGRGTGERLVVDPNKGSVLFLGTNIYGLYKSTDSGATWSKVNSFTPTKTTFVLFDKSTGVNGSATPTIYVGVAETSSPSLYKSTDGGASWTAVAGTPAGLMPKHAAFDGAGYLYLSFADAQGPNGVKAGGVYKLNIGTGVWQNITPLAPSNTAEFGYSGLSVSVKDPNRIVVTTINRWWPGDEIFTSADGGASWSALNARSKRTAPNNPWLVASQGGTLDGRLGHWITDVDIDPFNSDNVIFNTGYGIWESNNLTTSGTVNWAFNNRGIEETVPTDLVSTNSGAHLLMTQGDVAGGRYTTLTESDVNGFFSDPFISNLSIDAAELAPNKVVRTARNAEGGYLSNDNGITWAKFASTPVTNGNDVGEAVVTAKGTSIIWVPNNQGAYYSADGASWAASTGYPKVSGKYFSPVADRAEDGYVYTSDYSTGQIYESSNGGQSFVSVVSGLPVDKASTLIAVPGLQRRDLWVTTSESGLYHIDGPGSSPVKITSVQDAYLVNYGAPAPGKTYYALYLWGKVNGQIGIFRSDDKAASWVRINDDAHQYMYINKLIGDPRAYGRVYLATSGRGVIVGNIGVELGNSSGSSSATPISSSVSSSSSVPVVASISSGSSVSAPSSTPASSSAPASSSSSIAPSSSSTSSTSSSAASNLITMSAGSADWEVGSGVGITQSSNEVVFAISSQGQEVFYNLAGPIDLVGSKLTFVLNFDSAFVNSVSGGMAGIMMFVAFEKTAYSSDYICWTGFQTLVAGQDATFSCTGFTKGNVNPEGVKVGLQFYGTGSVTVRSATLELAP